MRKEEARQQVRLPERSHLRLRLVISFLERQQSNLNKEMAMSPEVYKGLVEMLTFVKEYFEKLMIMGKQHGLICPLPVLLEPREVMPKIFWGV